VGVVSNVIMIMENVIKKSTVKILCGLLLGQLLLTGCSTNRSQVGAVLGGGTAVASCAQFTGDPAVLFVCTMGGSFAGAEIMYQSDYDVHNAVFVDHLNNGPAGSSYTNWYNQKTGNSGIIKTTRSYMTGPIKCKDYDATIDITNQWPLVGLGNVNRRMVFGTACQLPDGKWVEKHVN
jgi:surface antigen